MSIFAAVMTGTGTGALSTIQVLGDAAEGLIRQIFTPTAAGPASFETGKILLGTIRNGDEVLDQVTIGCEGPETFAIHCHGNPLIVERIMQRLQQRDATLLSAEQLMAMMLKAHQPDNTIAIEAQLAQPKTKTLPGAKIVAGQIDAGLTSKARDWLGRINEISLDTIKAEAIQILQKSQAAKLILYGCTAVLAGPPNSGKSTLLNYLAGRQKSIVTDIEGTTRDWVEATCPVGPLSVTLIDTAGLVREGETTPVGATPCGCPGQHRKASLTGAREPAQTRLRVPPAEDTIEQAAQNKTIEILDQADIVLLVLDNSRPTEKLDDYIIERIAGRKVITALNKSDLPAQFDAGRLPESLSNTVQISAKSGDGIEELKERILQACGAADLDLRQPICFTRRQENLLRQLTNADSKQQAALTITELLNG
jgi:tRNA modification GTPase